MELKEIYKSGNTTFNLKDRKVTIIDDPKQFKYYKKLGLDVFKEEVKKENKKKVD